MSSYCNVQRGGVRNRADSPMSKVLRLSPAIRRALADELLLDDRLLLILRAFLHEPLDRFVILVLAGAVIDHQVLFGQALLTLGLRCFELSTSARVLNLKTCHLAQCDINADIGTHLARHGLNVEVKRIPLGDIDVAAMLLSHAADEGVDFIVMGGYGHSRLREFLLGGVTRSILRSMTAPVLMSH